MSTSNAYHHGNLRAALLAAAGNILETQGLQALSLRAAAREAGVSHNAPYRHFENRDALLAALAGQGFVELGKALSEDDRTARGVAYVRFALDNPQRFRLMFGGVLSIDSHPGLREAASNAFDALQQAFAGHRSAAAAWSLVHGLAQLMLDGHLQRAAGTDPDRFIREVLGAVRIDGDKSAAGRP